MPIHIPLWFKDFPAETPEGRTARNKFFIKTASLLSEVDGTIPKLAKRIGVPYSTLVSCGCDFHGIISPEMAVRLEQAIGRDLMPRELLRPDVFRK